MYFCLTLAPLRQVGSLLIPGMRMRKGGVPKKARAVLSQSNECDDDGDEAEDQSEDVFKRMQSSKCRTFAPSSPCNALIVAWRVQCRTWRACCITAIPMPA